MARRALGFTAAMLLGIAAVGVSACGGDDPVARPMTCAELQVGALAPRSQCGPGLELTPINQYDGEIASVQDREDAVVLINGDCTGTLIAAAAGPVVLTAGHCVGLGDRSLLVFNFEDDPDGDPLVTNGTVIERADQPDYALIQLDQLPAIAPTQLTSAPTDLLAIIQHPRGMRKVIAEGAFLNDCTGQVFYADLDTLAGSSGAGVLNHQGYLYAVHVDGDCDVDGSGTNSGWSAASIVQASPYLVDGDLAAR